jgi:hypothetical protein
MAANPNALLAARNLLVESPRRDSEFAITRFSPIFGNSCDPNTGELNAAKLYVSGPRRFVMLSSTLCQMLC